MASYSIVFLLLSAVSFSFLVSSGTPENDSSQNKITPGMSLRPVATKKEPSSWSSPSRYFSFGFYLQAKAKGYAIGIWLVGSEENTTVWTANRDDPSVLVTNNPVLVFTEDGKLLLKTADGRKIHIAESNTTTNPASSASMLNSGNFVLYDNNHSVVWNSFDHPTDTLLQGQVLPSGTNLYSSTSEINQSRGNFQLAMQWDGNLVLYPRRYGSRSTDAYWASDTAKSNEVVKYNLFLNQTGILSIVDSSNDSDPEVILLLNDKSTLQHSSGNKNTIFRAILKPEGMFQLYSHTPDENNNQLREYFIWSLFDNPCLVSGTCGLNSYCTTNDIKSDCLCLPGTDFANSINGRTLDCLRKYPLTVCRDGKENTTLWNITEMENIYWSDTPYVPLEEMSIDQCRKSCLEDCNCRAALYDKKTESCTKHQLPLKYARRDFQKSTTTFFKVTKTMSTNTNKTREKSTPNVGITSKNMVQIIVLVLGFTMLSFVALAIFGIYIFKIRDLRYKRLRDIGNSDVVDDQQLTLRVFFYNDLKRATNGFKEELGKGSFGAVYKGALNRGRKLVAVKRLEKLVEEGEREFLAEMRAIGRANHKNVVRLLGYCVEGSKRLLVYEYMRYGSLADLLFKNDSRHPDWEERVRIAIDVARGILYLHEECKVPIIHCDIKPQNILMDDFWTAKISDFGLAKLLMPDQTRTMTRVRGTRGYLAPEWHKNTPISVKADVYSYGIVLLEIICCRRNFEVNAPDPDEIVLATWVYKCFASMELNKLVIGEEADKKTLENMVKVALWCIQDEPALRPSMKSVVLMLEGITDISIPPCPTYSPNLM